MDKNHLALSDAALSRAKIYADVGETEKAYEAYYEAADEMLRFSASQSGERRKNAQKLAEALMQKAQTMKKQSRQEPKPELKPQPKPEPKPQPGLELKPEPKSEPKSEPKPQPKPQSQPQLPDEPSAGKDIKSFAKFQPVGGTDVRFSDIAGLELVKKTIQLKVIEPILHPELYERFGKTGNGGILLYGPPGTGKTMIARAIATETGLDFFSVRCSDIVGNRFGDGERNLRELFDAARASGRAMIFFDEFEALACKRGRSIVMSRIVPELLSQMDGFQKAEGQLIVLASTNRPWDLDTAVLRPPRMTERIYVGLPDHEARRYIVWKELDPLPKEAEPDYDGIADALEGFNCADIVAFTEKVKDAPIMRGLQDGGNVEQFITQADIDNALARSHSSVQQSDLEELAKWEKTQN